MGERIAELRHKCGLSQAELAKPLGLSASTIAMYEQGKREPSVSILIALAAALGVTIDYLLTGQPPQQIIPVPKVGNTAPRQVVTLLSAAWHIGKYPE